MTAALRPPEAVGPVIGTVVPKQLPMIGAKVIDVDGSVGFVAHYQYHQRDQQWFPVNFPQPGGCVKTFSRRLGEVASRAGYVRLAEPPPVTPLDVARKPPR